MLEIHLGTARYSSCSSYIPTLRSEQQLQLLNTPGTEVSTSRDPQKKSPSSTSVLIVASGPKLQLSPIRAPSCKASQVRLANPSFHYTPGIVLPLVLLPHAEHHRRGQLQSSGFTAPAVFYFKL